VVVSRYFLDNSQLGGSLKPLAKGELIMKTNIVNIALVLVLVFSLTVLQSLMFDQDTASAINSTAPGIEWDRTFGSSDYETAHHVQQTTDGGYIIAGRSDILGSDWDIYLIKTDDWGNTEWERTFGGSDYESAFHVQQTTDGGYIIAGTTQPSSGSADVYLIKTDSLGYTEWERTFGGSGHDRASCVQQTTDGGYIIGGDTHPSGGSTDAYLIKIDSLGDAEWERTFGGSGHDYVHHIQQTSDGGYIIAGETNSYGAVPNDVYMVKTDSLGNIEWEMGCLCPADHRWWLHLCRGHRVLWCGLVRFLSNQNRYLGKRRMGKDFRWK